MKSTKDSLAIGSLSMLVFIVLIFFVNIFYPIPTEFVIFCGLGVGVGNFLVNKFFIPKE